MNTQIVAQLSTVPAKTEFWQGYDQFCECASNGDWLSNEEYAAMTPAERRGYESALRHQADADTYTYLANVNSFGDFTEGRN